MSDRSGRAHGLMLAAALAVVAGGCFMSNAPADGGDGAVEDGALRDGAVGDAETGPPLDGGMCEPFGTTRPCAPQCGLPCPEGRRCNEFWELCTYVEPREECGVDLRFGNPFNCREGRTCVTTERFRSSEWSWGGACVDPEFCRWLQTNPDVREDQRCRYSEGTLFEDGPPDHPCAPGADELAPFCGGACGDACPIYPREYGGCVGVSETRGFGVCVPQGHVRCDPASEWQTTEALGACFRELWGLSGDTDQECVCMALSPTLLPEYADNGWAVSQQTCVAYRARYPDEVRCLDATWTEVGE